MFTRNYYISAKCTDKNGYCFKSTIGSYTSILSDSLFVFDDMSKKVKEDLLAIRPSGFFEVVSFNRI